MSTDPSKTVPSSGGKVPLVSEVLERLVSELGGEASRRPAYFQAALQVCSEELRSVKTGARAATLEELVLRSRKLLGASPPAKRSAVVDVAPSASQAELPFPDDDRAGQRAAVMTAAVPEPPAVSDDDLFTIDDSSAPIVSAGRGGLPPPAPAAPGGPRTPAAPAGGTPAEEPLEIAAPAVRDLFGSLTAGSPAPLETPEAAASGEEFSPTRFEEYGQVAPPLSRRVPLGVALGGTALVAIVVAALWLFGGSLREAVLPTAATSRATPSAVPGRPSAVESEAGTTGAPALAGVTAPTAVPPPTPAPTAVAATPGPARRSRPALTTQAAVMVSPDWAGRPPTYVIHFSSYQDRGRAERDAVTIGAAYGRPAAVAAVDLGARGLWHRVVLIGFANYEEARAYHTRLRAQGTEGVGGVYYLVGPE